MAGEYREPVITGFKKLSHNELADAFENRDIKLAISNSITVAVIRKPELTPVIIEALKISDGEKGTVNKYISGLETGDMIPVVNNCDEINARLGDRYWKPGELFFTS